MALKQENVENEKMKGMLEQLVKGNDDILRIHKRLWVSITGDLRDRILEEAHKFKYTMHPGSTKMYQNLKENY